MTLVLPKISVTIKSSYTPLSKFDFCLKSFQQGKNNLIFYFFKQNSDLYSFNESLVPKFLPTLNDF
jgi:hypothetical protein